MDEKNDRSALFDCGGRPVGRQSGGQHRGGSETVQQTDAMVRISSKTKAIVRD